MCVCFLYQESDEARHAEVVWQWVRTSEIHAIVKTPLKDTDHGSVRLVCWGLKGKEIHTHASRAPKFWGSVPLHADFKDVTKDPKEKATRRVALPDGWECRWLCPRNGRNHTFSTTFSV